MASSANASQAKAKTAEKSKHFLQIATSEITQLVVLARDAVASGDWIWPLRGQYYFLTHPALLKPLWPAIIRSSLLTIVITVFLFIFTYLPHVAVLAFVSGPLAFAAAVPIILGEGAAAGVFLSRIWWLGDAIEDLFDEVLLQEGLVHLVSQGRELTTTTSSQGKHGKKLGRLLTKPLDRFSKENIVRWLISLPLNAIPVVGPASFFLYNGAKSGPSNHTRYFQLKSREASSSHKTTNDISNPPGSSVGITSSPVFDRDEWVKQHHAGYAAFGATSMALDVLVPGGAIVCLLGNVVGAALWAVHFEKAGARKAL